MSWVNKWREMIKSWNATTNDTINLSIESNQIQRRNIKTAIRSETPESNVLIKWEEIKSTPLLR